MTAPATDQLRSYRVTLDVVGGQAALDVPSFLGPEAAGRRAFWAAASLGWGDLEEIRVVSVEHDDLPDGLYVEDDADDDPTIWLTTDDPERPLALLGHCAFARLVGGDDHALPLWHRLTAGLPTSAPAVTG